MNQFEFDALIGPGGSVKMPSELAAQVSPGQPVRVVVIIPDNDEERAWVQASTESFLQGYAESDGIYDELSKG